jgi:hypothetical protein
VSGNRISAAGYQLRDANMASISRCERQPAASVLAASSISSLACRMRWVADSLPPTAAFNSTHVGIGEARQHQGSDLLLGALDRVIDRVELAPELGGFCDRSRRGLRHGKRADHVAQRPQLGHDLGVAQRCFRLGVNNPRRNTHAREFLDTEKLTPDRHCCSLLPAHESAKWHPIRRLMRLHAKPLCLYNLRLNTQFMRCVTAA